MNSKIINLSARIKKRVETSSKELFDQSFLCGVTLDFSMQEFSKLNHNLYQLYQKKQEVNNYEDDMNLFITHALLKKLESTDRTLKLEDVLDSIWEIKTSKDELKKKLKVEYLYKFYQSI